MSALKSHRFVDALLVVLLLTSIISLYLMYSKPDDVALFLGRLSGEKKEEPLVKAPRCGVQRLSELFKNESEPQKFCLILHDLDQRMDCYRGMGLEPSPFCEKISEYQARIFCYNNVSRIDKNPALCDILWGEERMKCRGGCALNLLQPNLCEVWTNPVDRYSCFGKAAGENEDESLCDLIPIGEVLDYSSGGAVASDVLRDLCRTSFAAYVSDASFCGNVADPEIRLFCSAVSTGRNESCMQIEDSFHREKCFKTTYIAERERLAGNPYYADRRGRSYFPVYSTYTRDGVSVLW